MLFLFQFLFNSLFRKVSNFQQHAFMHLTKLQILRKQFGGSLNFLVCTLRSLHIRVKKGKQNQNILQFGVKFTFLLGVVFKFSPSTKLGNIQQNFSWDEQKLTFWHCCVISEALCCWEKGKIKNSIFRNFTAFEICICVFLYLSL